MDTIPQVPQQYEFAVRALARRTAMVLAGLLLAGNASAAVPRTCTVSFKMNELVAVGSVRFTANYPAGVELVGSGAAASCRSLVRDDEPVSAEFVDDDAGTLSVHLSSAGGFPGFNALAICDLLSDHAVTNDEFAVTTTEVLDPLGLPIDPMPAVSVLEAFCPTTTTTTTTSTTTSLPAVTTTTMPLPSCGDPDASGSITPTDALFVLRAAVQGGPCPPQVCDADGNGSITASDALRILRVAVGGAVVLACPA